MTSRAPLPPEDLRRRCDPASLGFETTAELEDPAEGLGQDRALEAVRFAIGIRRDGYNLFALGPGGVGKHGVVQALLEARARGEPAPSDVCYVHNFAEPHRPRALLLPAGRASAFRLDMERLVADLRAAIPAAFESDDYRNRKRVLEEQFRERNEKAFAEIERHAAERKISVLRTPVGVAFAPSRDGEVIEAEEFERLPEEEKSRYKAEMKALQEELRSTLADLPSREREHRDRLKRLEQEVTAFAVRHFLEDMKARYQEIEAVRDYLDALQRDVVEHADDFLPRTDSGREGLAALIGSPRRDDGHPFRRYEVNVLVERAGGDGAPVVYEDYPTLPNLLGRVEYHSELGTLVTDFRLIKAGALHRANGGYLILDALKLLQQQSAWEQLKRALRSRRIRIESLGQVLGLTGTVTLDPEAIPLDLKVVLVGERYLYYLLAAHDPDLSDLFKVSADFEDRVDRYPAGERLFAEILGALARREGLLHLDRGAVARMVEEGARRAEDSEKLSIHLESLADLLREADHGARAAERTLVSAEDVENAVAAQIRRLDRVRQRTQEEIRRGTILIETAGAIVGQLNGLSVLQLGGFAFGRPSRITARVRLGSGKVVDIEREVALGGPIHSKGVLILAGFLGARYAPEDPLSLSATLVFEQSYSGVEGDSASLAELLALLSALSETPLKQSLAVTGSVNQLGAVQPVGGLNEKVEGFFDVCRAAGLTGEQGVVLPAANVKHLMLRSDVVAAAAEGRFRVYPVETVDEALEIVTGIPAGERDAEGRFPEGSVNQRVQARLTRYAEKARAFGRPPGETGR